MKSPRNAAIERYEETVGVITNCIICFFYIIVIFTYSKHTIKYKMQQIKRFFGIIFLSIILSNVVYGQDFIGTAQFGPNSATGMIFTINQDGSNFNIIKLFNPSEGKSPIGLTMANDGNFYGTCNRGGVYTNAGYDITNGTLFRISPQGQFTKLKDLTTIDGYNLGSLL
ncbi:MAG: hypothetical protein SFY32_09640 [Bacteroidota bacterium]|nr:hypothetical protein [Bacteroidota bacterium]